MSLRLLLAWLSGYLIGFVSLFWLFCSGADNMWMTLGGLGSGFGGFLLVYLLLFWVKG